MDKILNSVSNILKHILGTIIQQCMNPLIILNSVSNIGTKPCTVWWM